MKAAGILLVLMAFTTAYTFAGGQTEGAAGKLADSITAALIENTSDYKTMKPALEEWGKRNNVKVEVIGYPNKDHKNALVTAWAAGSDKFDLVQQGPITEFVDAGFIIPLDGSANPAVKLTKEYLDQIYESVYEMSMYKGKPYILYYSTDANPLIWRKDLLQAAGLAKPGDNWPDFVRAAIKLTRDNNGDGVTDVWGFSSWYSPQTNANARQWREVAFNEGSEWWANNDYVFTDEPSIRAMQLHQDMIHKYKITPLAATTWYQNEQFNAIKAGQVAMSQIGIWQWGSHNADDSPVKGKLGIGEMPAGAKRRSTELGGNGIQIPKLTKKAATAWQAALFACSEEMQIRMQQSRLDWSAMKSIYKNAAAIAGMEEAAAAYEASLLRAHTLPKSPYGSEVELIIAKHMDRVLHNAASPKQGLEDAYKEVKATLKW
jgi:multiple sugar transport system substrate-binding protein